MKYYTVSMRLFETTSDDPRKVAGASESIETNAFSVRADSYGAAVRKALAHLQLELPESTFHNQLDKELNGL